ncbi:hypothetical protein HGO38_01600 [Rhizobium sp. CG5]|nr:hypothetical protein [Rhizobium sp. CG5]MCM2472171.1 hypothetical protein [Rhizobium sp. CG5]
MDPVLIPKGVGQDDQWRLWGQDRRALADCKQRDAAKAAVIAAFETQGAR